MPLLLAAPLLPATHTRGILSNDIERRARLMAALQHVGGVSSFLGARCRNNRLAMPVARARSQSPSFESPLLASNFAEHMLALEAVLPTMSCSQLAETATSVRETYRAALLSTEAADNNNSTAEVQDVGLLLDYFNSQLPNQSWLLTYRAAVERHLLPQEGTQQAHQPGTAESGSSAGSAGGQHASSAVVGPAAAYSCTPEHLAEILSTIATLPIQVVQPLPIGFGTPRWSRPLAAADPTAWEQWLATLAMVYSELLAQQHLKPLQQQQQQQHTPGSHADQTHPHPHPEPQQQQQQQVVGGCEDVAAAVNCSSEASTELLQQLADFTICLACSMRWVNVNVDDDRLQTPEFRERVLQSLRLQQQQEQEAAAGVEQWQQQRQQQRQQNEAVGRAGIEQQKHLGAATLQPQEPSSMQQQLQQPAQQQQQQQDIPAQQMQQVPFALAGSLAHRLTYTCLLLLLPPPRPLLAAFFRATDPQDFSLVQLQGIVRGLLFVGCAPPEPWLKGLVQLVRARAGELGQRDVLGFVEAFRFFGTQAGRVPWLRDVTAMLEEFSCVG